MEEDYGWLGAAGDAAWVGVDVGHGRAEDFDFVLVEGEGGGYVGLWRGGHG